jgi:DNA-binding HxlR family transcriptional regulator
MLTVTLRQLERDGLVRRIVHADVPPWSEYGVTDLGLTLREPVVAIAAWALDHREEILSNRETFDASHAE